MPTTIKEALKQLRDKGLDPAELEKVDMYGQCPPIEKMDGTLSTLKACKHLALSTNNIDKIAGLAGMDNLRILSLARNCLKKIENLDVVAETLEELWLSYNVLEKLVGAEKLTKLKVLYLTNNKIKDWAEIDRLSELEQLEDLQLIGNPLANEYKDNNAVDEYRIEVVRRLPQLKKLDGVPVDVDEREQAQLKG